MSVELIYHGQDFTALGGYADAFRSYAVLGGEVISVHRRFRMHRTDQLFLGGPMDSEIVLTRRLLNATWFKPVREEVLGQGVDPRIVSDGDRAYVVYADYLEEDAYRPVFRVRELPSGKTRIYEHTDFPMGKNWQPFLRDGRLFVLHEFSPARVIELCLDGRIATVSEHETGFTQTAPHDGYTIHRGGSNGVVGPDGNVYGYGHFTFANHTHAPFPWRLSPDGQLDCGEAMMFPAFRDQGFNLHDVTSFFVHDGDSYLGLTLSERDWFHGQRMANVLLRLPVDDLPHLFANSQSWVRGAPGLPGIKRTQTVFPSDHPFDCPVEEHLGSRRSLGQPGFVMMTQDVLGTCPNQPYRLEVTYHCPQAPVEDVGFVKLSEFRGVKLSSPPRIALLNGTGDAEATATVAFTPGDGAGFKLGICAYGPALTVLNVRLCEV